MTSGIISIQLTDYDLDGEDKIKSCCENLVPILVQEMKTAIDGPQARGCSVSGSVSAGPGGATGSATVTCTF